MTDEVILAMPTCRVYAYYNKMGEILTGEYEDVQDEPDYLPIRPDKDGKRRKGR
jgi:hypothetical protein